MASFERSGGKTFFCRSFKFIYYTLLSSNRPEMLKGSAGKQENIRRIVFCFFVCGSKITFFFKQEKSGLILFFECYEISKE
jgi:hypothetical protein